MGDEMRKIGKNIYIHPTARVDYCYMGENIKIWHNSHICERAMIGDDCTIGQNVYIGPGVKIGKGCKIQNNAYLPEGVIIEDYVFIGPSVTFTNIKYPDARIEQKDKFLTTRVLEGAVIGAGATILPGLAIGVNSFVGAGSVVTWNVYGGVTVVGNPAKAMAPAKGGINGCD
jgi:UDP-2-acetamido-3-amino-2,3-dideoxy-glucuronate N-acetyltransferase